MKSAALLWWKMKKKSNYRINTFVKIKIVMCVLFIEKNHKAPPLSIFDLIPDTQLPKCLSSLSVYVWFLSFIQVVSLSLFFYRFRLNFSLYADCFRTLSCIFYRRNYINSLLRHLTRFSQSPIHFHNVLYKMEGFRIVFYKICKGFAR